MEKDIKTRNQNSCLETVASSIVGVMKIFQIIPLSCLPEFLSRIEAGK